MTYEEYILNKTEDTVFGGSLVVPSEINKGIKVNGGSNTVSIMDLKGILIIDRVGVNAPSLEVYKTGIEDFAYASGDKQRWRMHVEHWDQIGGDKYLHAHIRHNGTAISGDLVITFDICHNYGHSRPGSPDPIQIVQTVASADIATKMSQYDTLIEDILMAQSGGGAGLIDSDNWLPDDDILITMTVTTLPTITGGTTNRVFIPYCDIHCGSTNVGTKNRAPDFWS